MESALAPGSHWASGASASSGPSAKMTYANSSSLSLTFSAVFLPQHWALPLGSEAEESKVANHLQRPSTVFYLQSTLS
jgi:hypothetical protein